MKIPPSLPSGVSAIEEQASERGHGLDEALVLEAIEKLGQRDRRSGQVLLLLVEDGDHRPWVEVYQPEDEGVRMLSPRGGTARATSAGSP